MTWELLRNCGTNYELSSTISLLGGLAAFYIFKSTPNRIKWFGILLIPLFYWLFGYGIFVFILLLIIDQLRGKQYIIPVVFTITSIIIPVVTRQHYHLTSSQAYQYPASSFIDKPDFQFEKLLALSVESSSGHWGKVATLTEKDPQKSSIIAYFYNLSHGMMGDLPDKILETYQPGPLGLLIQLKPTTPLFSIWNSSEAWFQLGDMTMAEHSAILGMIFSPKHRSAKMVMRLAEINMINGDTAATSKYLIMLQKTWLYKQWAQERIPGHESEYVKGWLKEKRSLIPQQDTLRAAFDYQRSLRNLLQTNSQNKLACDYLLCYDLLSKDINAFMNDYSLYKKGQIPGKLYSEALVLGLIQKHATAQEVQSYYIYQKVINDFNNYSQLYNQAVQSNDFGLLKSTFGKSYWFYYSFAKFKQS